MYIIQAQNEYLNIFLHIFHTLTSLKIKFIILDMFTGILSVSDFVVRLVGAVAGLVIAIVLLVYIIKKSQK